MVLRLDICLSTFFRSNSYRIPKYYLETTKRKNDKQSNNQIAKKYSKQLNLHRFTPQVHSLVYDRNIYKPNTPY